jgi:hypothetical protein
MIEPIQDDRTTFFRELAARQEEAKKEIVRQLNASVVINPDLIDDIMDDFCT